MTVNLKPHRLFFILILPAYMVVAGLYATYTPPWQTPDEPAHYNYARQLAHGRFPVMTAQDYDQEYQSDAISSGFADPYDPLRFSYEDYQPPLYYLLQSAVYRLSGGDLIAMRLFDVLLGAVTLTAAYAVFSRWFAGRWWALTAVAFFAFLPQHIAIQAGLNNDSLAELLIAVGVWWLWRHLDEPNDARPWILLGAWTGLAFVTKVTAYLLAPVIAVAVLWRYWGEWDRFWRIGLWVAIPAFAIGSLWWGRNLAVYGWPDVLGIRVHDAVVVGQPTTAEWVEQFGLTETIRRGAQTTFRSFWGQFGWMGVVMPTWVYRPLLLFSGAVVAGWGIDRARHGWDWRPGRVRSAVGLSLLILLTLNVALYLTYNLTYVQHQGRYLFAALVPISIGVAQGIRGWTDLLTARWDRLRPWLPLVPLGLFTALVGLDILALFWFIVPALTSAGG